MGISIIDNSTEYPDFRKLKSALRRISKPQRVNKKNELLNELFKTNKQITDNDYKLRYSGKILIELIEDFLQINNLSPQDIVLCEFKDDDYPDDKMIFLQSDDIKVMWEVYYYNHAEFILDSIDQSKLLEVKAQRREALLAQSTQYHTNIHYQKLAEKYKEFVP